LPEYIYKGFKVHFAIKQNTKTHSFCATGSVVCHTEGLGPDLTQKFQTEGPSKTYVQQELKKIINDYIEFEWKQFIEMQGNS
jgi:hypothetical protein